MSVPSAPRAPSEGRPRLRKVARGVGVAVLALVGLNVGAWLLEGIPYGTVLVDGRPYGLYRDQPGPPRFRSGVHLRGTEYEITINALGFRGAELASDPGPEDVRIWCAGGSTAFDILVSTDAKAWPAQIEQDLRAATDEQRPARGGGGIEVVNAGIPGEVLSGSRSDLLDRGATVKPGVLVVYHGYNDLKNVLGLRPGPGPGAPLVGDFALLRALRTVVALPGGGTPLTGTPTPFAGHAREMLRSSFLDLVRAARQVGMEVVLATHAFRGQPGATGDLARDQVGEGVLQLRRSPEAVIAALDDMNDLIEEIARSEGLPLADVRAAVPGDARYWGDASHFSDEGAAIAGRVIADTILAAGLALPRERRAWASGSALAGPPNPAVGGAPEGPPNPAVGGAPSGPPNPAVGGAPSGPPNPLRTAPSDR